MRGSSVPPQMPLRTIICIVHTQGRGGAGGWTYVSYPMSFEKGKVAFAIICPSINKTISLCISLLENYIVATARASGVSFSLACLFLRCFIS